MSSASPFENPEALEVFSVTELWRLPTLCVGQAEDLKVDEGDLLRWWLSRCDRSDGQDFPIGVEAMIGGSWREVHRYGSWDEYDALAGTVPAAHDTQRE